MDNRAGVETIADKLLLFSAAAAFLVTVCIYICNWWAALSSPYSINFEGTMLWSAQAFAGGQNIYALKSLGEEPWLVTIYPPLYLACAAALVKLFGVQYLPLRLANMLLSAGTGCLLFRIMKASGCRLSACLCALTFLFSFDVMSMQSFEARPDYLLIFLSVFMIERFVSKWDFIKEKDSLSALAPVLTLACLSMITKQQAVVFVLSLVLFLASSGRAKLALKFFLSVSLGIGLFVLLAQMITGGFLAHLTFLAATRSSSAVLISNLAGLGLDWVKIFWALPVVPCGILALKKLEGLHKLPFILVTVSTLLFLYSMGIPASNTNHLMPALLALSWCLAICLSSLPGWVGIVGLLACCVSFPHLSEEARLRPLLLPHARKGADELHSLDLASKPVLTDDVYLNILTDSKPVIVDCPTFLNVWAAKGSDFRQLTEPIENKQYAAVIINSDDSQMSAPTIWWPKPVVEAVRRNYHKVSELHCSGWGMDLFLPGVEATNKRESDQNAHAN
jgi:hypothetical protein